VQLPDHELQPAATDILPDDNSKHNNYNHCLLHSVLYILHYTFIYWSQLVTNAEISARTGLPPVMDFIRRRRLSVFGHIARLTQGTPAHNALHCQVGLASGRSLGRDWRRRPGRPRARWTDQLRNDTGSVPANLWRQTDRQTGHSTWPWWSDATARAGYTMMTTYCIGQHVDTTVHQMMCQTPVLIN